MESLGNVCYSKIKLSSFTLTQRSACLYNNYLKFTLFFFFKVDPIKKIQVLVKQAQKESTFSITRAEEYYRQALEQASTQLPGATELYIQVSYMNLLLVHCVAFWHVWNSSLPKFSWLDVWQRCILIVICTNIQNKGLNKLRNKNWCC